MREQEGRTGRQQLRRLTPRVSVGAREDASTPIRPARLRRWSVAELLAAGAPRLPHQPVVADA